MVLQLNPTYSHSQVRSRHIALQSPMMDLVWILLFMVPGGAGSRKHFWMSGCSTLALIESVRSLASVYRRHEQEKRQQYEQRVQEVEHCMFTPLVMLPTGGMGRAATAFYKRLASMISDKRDVPYGTANNWIRCRLSFALLRASITSIRGVRSSQHCPASESIQGLIDLQLAESHIH